MNRRDMLKNLALLTGGALTIPILGCNNESDLIVGSDQPTDPDKVDLYPGVPKSDIYEVTVIREDGNEELVVFQSSCPEYELGKKGMEEKDQYPLDIFAGRSISWVDFSFEYSVTVEVRVTDQSKVSLSNSVKIFPSRYEISPTVDGDVIRFTLNEPGQFSVEIGDEGYKNGLMIFANPAETDVPDPSSEEYFVVEEADQAVINSISSEYSGIYFKDGIHNIEIFDVPGHIKNIYFKEGSWVYGALILDGNPGVKIFGRGVLSSAKLDYREAHGIEAINGSNDVTLEGIVIADFKHFAVRFISTNDKVDWVKVIGGWVYNCDGIRVGRNSSVSNCFIWANDDAIKVYRDNITFSDCVCWHLNNGGTIQLSWGKGNATNVSIKRIDILHAEWNKDEFNRGVINCVGDRREEGGLYGLQRNWIIEDLVTETSVPLIFNITPNPASPNHIDGMVFKNWDVKMDMKTGFNNYIIGNDPENKFSGLVFDNFKFNGTELSSSNWKPVGKFVTDNIEEPAFINGNPS